MQDIRSSDQQTEIIADDNQKSQEDIASNVGRKSAGSFQDPDYTSLLISTREQSSMPRTTAPTPEAEAY